MRRVEKRRIVPTCATTIATEDFLLIKFKFYRSVVAEIVPKPWVYTPVGGSVAGKDVSEDFVTPNEIYYLLDYGSIDKTCFQFHYPSKIRLGHLYTRQAEKLQY